MDVISQMRGPVATRDSLLTAIAALNPTSAQWWQYAVSHGRFLLRIYSDSSSDYIIIGSLFAGNISGPTGWSNPRLDFEIGNAPDFPSESQWRVTDNAAGFSLTCRKLYWGLNVGWNSDDETDWFR